MSNPIREAELKQKKRESRRAVISSYLGSTVEYYDFLLYGSAASLVFPALFFSDLDPGLGIILSFLTLATGYIARPIGGLLFGHFGDKYGRKQILFITLVVMGIVSILIGLLPTYQTIGIAAPIALLALRVLQGLAVGGEWAGATLMAMEHSAKKSKGLGASIAVSGGPSGAVLATLVLGGFSLMPEEQFMSWGWRIPFLLSALLVVIGLYLRHRVTESPDFEQAKAKEAQQSESASVPIVELFRSSSKEIGLGTLSGIAPLFIQSLLATFALTYAVSIGHSRSDALLMLTIANTLHIFTIPLMAAISDRYGRRPVMLTGVVLGMILIWPMFELISHENPWMMLLGFIIGNPIIQAVMYGPMGAFISEKFTTRTRYTGLSLTYQLTSLIGAGFTPIIAQALLEQAGGGTNTHYIAMLFCVLCALTGIGVYLSKETAAVKQETVSLHAKAKQAI
ncbi:MFS transporter [Vibrio natriegens]|uniref:MFS transporter n=1 Tax=Vibrio natriegens NBRC 15636 = ATCC 14048 = DSM 759 TaxID=1219067 RepID=A0AAN0Y2L6_VIBNA|nr:MFS transporter [Vibrio natriegens]ALR15601.1 MFS transporter [Vibrio natriegens NBRC 15636 = ATCC 14048 = DSM 759]ANQ12542.1 MFS transporter [Vibrio natriegens NBRC 15636 = ATCC 14048 = DSM 759]EPM42366.1 transporter [Vibrio natriegens NBRC 15636 = ATCC 14048 = DSM 759]MDX6026930.1 MFS transporter [Vibrio natriegens NBRC 15636 = ATCC 14048 = DSM 759]UUI13012.1 MHS family MFS transporter [Vibrio natriegens]